MAEFETKFVLPNLSAPSMANWLRARCLPDPSYPAGLVSSLYYDSRDLRLLREKVNSDYLKTKVRVRWYADPASGTVEGPAFVEVKRKVGSLRVKKRIATHVPAAELAGHDLQSMRLLEVVREVVDESTWIDADLRPLLEIAFLRRRFVEPTTGARISIDTDIHARRVNPSMLPLVNPFPLAHAVLELKGPMRELPPALLPLCAMGCRKESFSKYARCVQKVIRRSFF